MPKDVKNVPGMGEVEFDFTAELSKKKAETTKEMPFVKVIPLIPREDDRGILLKDIQCINLQAGPDGKPMFAEHYNVINPDPMIRGFHGHRELWDYFCIIMGRAKFVLIDCRVSIAGKPNAAYGKVMEFFLSDRTPGLLVVPPGVYHGWKSYVPNTILSSTGSHLYDPKNPDEVRVPYNSFGYNWDIQIK